MPINLTAEQTHLHERAVACGRKHRRSEAQLMRALQDVERTSLWRKFDRTSLFAYAVGELKLTEPVAYAVIAVARKAALVPDLHHAIAGGQMSVSLASRIVACLTAENAAEVIAYALSHTCREVDWECAKRNPKKDSGDGAKPLSEKRIRLTVTVSRDTYEKLKRVQSLEASCGRSHGLERAIEAAAEEYLVRRDPVRKAARAQARPASGDGLCANRPKQNNKKLLRTPLTAAEKHEVHGRDGGRCTHVGESKKRCGSDRFVDVHHVHPVSRGGGTEPGNLTTLCSFHHDLVHQTSFPIDGQVSWIRARSTEYVY